MSEIVGTTTLGNTDRHRDVAVYQVWALENELRLSREASCVGRKFSQVRLIAVDRGEAPYLLSTESRHNRHCFKLARAMSKTNESETSLS